jgi:two-component system nitrogen regulation sensor histidine kinase NtrY
LVLHQNAHHDIVFSTAIPDAPPRISCDRRLMGQALTNLLANAADAVHARLQADAAAGLPDNPGKIRISVEPGEQWLTIAVEDNGTGLPEGEERERLTEPYVTHKPKGTGLGLAIVKKIMEDHGGKVLLTDLRSGEAGTRAALVFPVGNQQPEHGVEVRMTEVQQHGA